MKESKVYSVIHLRESIFEQDYLVISAYGREFLGADKRGMFKLVNPQTQRLNINTQSLTLLLSLSLSVLTSKSAELKISQICLCN